MTRLLRRLRCWWLEQLAIAAADEAAMHDSLADGNRQAAVRLHNRAALLKRRLSLMELE